MKALVTGACGFMGTHMIEVLTEAGYQIRATDLPSAYEKDDYKLGRFPSILKDKKIEFIPADMTQEAGLDALVADVDYVFHIAAIFSYSVPFEVLSKVNVEGTRNLLKAIQKSRNFKKLILWAAGGVYRFPKSSAELPIREESLIEPQNNYLKSKWEQECLVRGFCNENKIRWSALRPTTVYGPRGIYGAGKMIQDPLHMKTIMIPRNFNFRIPTIHVRDVCRAALFLAETAKTDGEVYNINDDSQTKTVDYMKMMSELTGKPFKLLPPIPVSLLRSILVLLGRIEGLRKKYIGGPKPAFEADMMKYFGVDMVYANDKIKKDGFKFEFPEFRDGLKQTLEWYHQHHKDLES